MEITIKARVKIIDMTSGAVLRNTTAYDTDVLHIHSIKVKGKTIPSVKLELLQHEETLRNLAQAHINSRIISRIEDEDESVMDLSAFNWGTEVELVDIQVLRM